MSEGEGPGILASGIMMCTAPLRRRRASLLRAICASCESSCAAEGETDSENEITRERNAADAPPQRETTGAKSRTQREIRETPPMQ